MTREQRKRRTQIGIGIIVAVFVCLVLYLVKVQIIDGDEYKAASASSAFFVILKVFNIMVMANCDSYARLMMYVMGFLSLFVALVALVALASCTTAPVSAIELDTTNAKVDYIQIAKEVIAGKWGNGTTRKKRLKAAGYDYNAIQKEVNRLTK